MKRSQRSWVSAGRSSVGGAHRRQGRGCDDAHVRLIDGSRGYVVAADGAGGASHSAIGAEAAVFAALDWLLQNQLAASDRAVAEKLQCCFASARQAVIDAANGIDVDPSQLACTLTVAVVDEKGVAAGQIGDGAIVAEVGGNLEALLWDTAAGPVNRTEFLTDAEPASDPRITYRAGEATGVVVVTDGIEGLTVSRDGSIREVFYRALLECVRARPAWGEDVGLDRFLESPAVRDRCDDDLTVAALALREERSSAGQSQKVEALEPAEAQESCKESRQLLHPATRSAQDSLDCDHCEAERVSRHAGRRLGKSPF